MRMAHSTTASAVFKFAVSSHKLLSLFVSLVFVFQESHSLVHYASRSDLLEFGQF